MRLKDLLAARSLFALLPLVALALLTPRGSLAPAGEEPPNRWPSWRGPGSAGRAARGHSYATRWSATEGLAWKVELPGAGRSTPIVWEGHIVLTSPSEGEDAVLDLDRTGTVRWTTRLGRERAGKHRNASGSNPSPTTDGNRIFAYFKSGTLAALDLRGEVLWRTHLQERFGKDTLWWDIGTSPVLTDRHVVVAVIHTGESYLAAFGKESGELAWKVSRNYRCAIEGDQSYATPLVARLAGRELLVVWGAEHLTAHSAADGSLLAECGGFNPDRRNNWVTVASPVLAGDVAVVPYGRGAVLAGIALEAEGNAVRAKRLWTEEEKGAFVPTPAASGDRAYVLRDDGEVIAIEAKSGTTAWREDLPKGRGKYYASPTIAGGKLYAAREDGVTFVLEIGESGTPTLVGENDVGERIIASPVPVDGEILLRGERHLFCIAAPEAVEPAAPGLEAEPSNRAEAPPSAMEPLFSVVDLDVGEKREVRLPGGGAVKVELLGLDERRCDLRSAVREAEVSVLVDGEPVRLVAATYHLPRSVGRVQIDCPVTRGYTQGSSKRNVWALDKDARLRVWPAGSPWIRPGTFSYPVNQRWFASDTQMGNDPCYVNACDVPGEREVYYHYGLDFGGAEGMVDVSSATDGVVISRAGEIVEGEHPPQVAPRHDVVYVRDARGWYYRYSHLQSILPTVRLGEPVRMGERIGVLGKEGGSGGWSHLHLDICMPQPSGRYGITDGYAFAFQAYRDRHRPSLIAVARPHIVAWTGKMLTLDGSRSWHERGRDHLRSFEWQLSDGRILRGEAVPVGYEKPGHYSEVLKVTDAEGRVAYDIAVVQVFSREAPVPVPPAIHVASWPTEGLRAGDEVTFKGRTFGVRPDEGEETWDFGDGSPSATTRSDGNADQHAPDGYAVIRHRFRAAGDFIVSARRSNDRGETATGRLWLRVAER